MVDAGCMLDKQGSTRARTCTRPRARTSTHARIYARAHTHTDTQICNVYSFHTVAVVSRTHFNVTLYVQCLLPILLRSEEPWYATAMGILRHVHVSILYECRWRRMRGILPCVGKTLRKLTGSNSHKDFFHERPSWWASWYGFSS